MLSMIVAPTRFQKPVNAVVGVFIFFANVRDDGSPLAFGADPASAGCVTKVPKAW